MKNIDKKKNVIVVIILIIFLIGIVGLIYVKINKKDNGLIENFDNNLDYNSLEISNSDCIDNKQNEDNKNSEKTICIHIVGEVNKEGIVKIKEGERIIDAIEKAGGVTEFADLKKVNLAFVLSDGQKVQIPNKNDDQQNFMYVEDNSGYNIIVDRGDKSNDGGDKVNINSATQTELETISGIGPSTALKIIEYREKNGKFNKIEDIKNINGIGNSKFEMIKESIVVK